MPEISWMEVWRMMLPPKPPPLTEKNLPDQSGKVFLITGASSGCGEALGQILYSRNAKVYVAARSEEKALKAIEGMKKASPNSTGELVFLRLDLSNLTSIKESAQEFTSAEFKLDVLWLNAGVMMPPQGSTTAQGWELQLGTNNLGHLLFFKFLEPVLRQTAKTAPAASVRVIWVSSSVAIQAPKPAVNFDNINYAKNESPLSKYGRSKAMNALQSVEGARRLKDDGVISLSLNPGNLKTELQRHVPAWQRILFDFILYPKEYGAYTELFAGLSTDIKAEHSGGWLQPWGRLTEGRQEYQDPELGKKYWEWCEEQIKDYL